MNTGNLLHDRLLIPFGAPTSLYHRDTSLTTQSYMSYLAYTGEIGAAERQTAGVAARRDQDAAVFAASAD
jgi:hypothetical protein